ncbi:Holliday junction recognition protein isoform X1 [Melopsittacus undulatus]|uniref:Holliday junction recognition protein isoform X1 n=2 Tax=Melopsittacus undulatus TaxID=13146 RepID=UPI00146F7D2B|nr:Holliday junction recognition protein isoform X1 [Melopsittacus undulatus]
MAWDLDERLRQSNARFLVSFQRILERYNHPFEDDLLISMETLTYDTPDGQKHWEHISAKKIKTWKQELFKRNRRSQRNAETSKQQASDFEDEHPTVCQESPENSHVDASDIGGESDAEIVSVRRKFEDIHFQNSDVDDEKKQEKVKVQVDVIVQDNARNIPQWITVAPQGSLKALPSASPGRELIGNQAAVYRNKGEFSNECSSRSLWLQFSSVPISTNTVIISRDPPSPELNKSCWDSVLEEYQSADEACSWSSLTLADLYPAMVKILTRLMTKQSRRKELRYMFRCFRHKRWHSRRLKLNVTLDKIREFKSLNLKQAQSSICSDNIEDIQNRMSGNENGELCDVKCSNNNFSGLVPYSHIDTKAIKEDYSETSLEHHLVSVEGQKVSKQTHFPNVMARMGETFLVEDALQTTVTLKSSKCKGEKLACKCSSEHRFITTTASSGSTAFQLVKASKTQKTDFPDGNTLGLRSSTYSSYGNSNTFTPVTNCSLVRASNTLLINPENLTSGRLTSFQHKQSFTSLSTVPSTSNVPQKYEDAFEKLYYKLCSTAIQKPWPSTRPRSNSQNLEERGRLVKSKLRNSVSFDTHCDREFDRIYEQSCKKAVPKLPGFQSASNVRKYEGMQMSETVNALVYSPVRTLLAIPSVKRIGSFQNDIICSPGKRLKNMPEHYSPSAKHQVYHRKNITFPTAGMDSLNTYSGGSSSFFDSHSFQSQDSGFHDSSDKISLSIPGTSLQGYCFSSPESGIANVHSGWPGAMKNCSYPRNASKHHERVYRKLSYTDGKDQNPSSSLGNFMVKTHQGAFMDCYKENVL